MYRRFMAIGCSHGIAADPDAIEAVLKFEAAYKPETRVHLGDVNDLAAFRSGAKGTRDEAEKIGPDIRAGCDLIRRYRPTHVIIGNHDVRVWKMANHPNAIMAHAAACVRNEFLEACAGVDAHIVDHYKIRKSWLTLGDTKFLHGYMYGENAIRDHAEHFGKSVFAQLHTPGIAKGRAWNNPTGYCVGMLADIEQLDYADCRRATARWGLGFAWGEYSDTYCHVNLSMCECGEARNWRLPG